MGAHLAALHEVTTSAAGVRTKYAPHGTADTDAELLKRLRVALDAWGSEDEREALVEHVAHLARMSPVRRAAVLTLTRPESTL